MPLDQTDSLSLGRYSLFEVRVTLAALTRDIRVRTTSAAAAEALVLEHRPGWTVVDVRRWAEEGWVTP